LVLINSVLQKFIADIFFHIDYIISITWLSSFNGGGFSCF